MKKILLLATGGTIASRRNESGLSPQMRAGELLSYLPEAGEFCRLEAAELFQLDSTNIQPEHWLRIAREVEARYPQYDGFVICHGTDTLAYTGAGLSYLIQSSPKPIVLTGAQRPIDADSTDARINLMDSIRLAASDWGGVSIVFDGHVIAGARARKTRSKSYNAFSSINFPDLAEIRGGKLLRFLPPRREDGPVFFHTLNPKVFLLKLYPGMPAEIFSALENLCDGLIIESYGVGGIPDCYLEQLERLIIGGKTVVMATQVPKEGSDLSIYQVGSRLKEKYDLLESADMTLEATVTKLMWVLGQTGDPEKIRLLFKTPIGCDRME